ncbi:hypothetical protein C8Q72DRAFT_29406 [Fomitopsis betulina]|nr:hypothetical protein C8Q72DRAFT_29406 [Fomitopsis betulina]
MSLRPFFRTLGSTHEPRRHSAPDVLRHTREQPAERGRKSESGLGRPKSWRRASWAPFAIDESDSPTITGPIFVSFNPIQWAGERATQASLPQNAPPTAPIGLGVDPLNDNEDDEDDVDELLVDLLPSPSQLTSPVAPAQASYTGADIDYPLDYTISPPGLELPLADERVIESSPAAKVVSWNAPDILIEEDEDEDDGFMAIELDPFTLATIVEVPEMPDISIEEEQEFAARIQRDIMPTDFPPTPSAPRLPYITRFSFDPLYA